MSTPKYGSGNANLDKNAKSQGIIPIWLPVPLTHTDSNKFRLSPDIAPRI